MTNGLIHWPRYFFALSRLRSRQALKGPTGVIRRRAFLRSRRSPCVLSHGERGQAAACVMVWNRLPLEQLERT